MLSSLRLGSLKPTDLLPQPLTLQMKVYTSNLVFALLFQKSELYPASPKTMDAPSLNNKEPENKENSWR